MEQIKEIFDTIVNQIYKLNQQDPFYNFKLTRGMCLEDNDSIHDEMEKTFCDIDSYRFDYVRIKTAELLAKEISRKNLDGSVAEFGVYRGDFTYVLSRLFPHKTLHLFDTFRGFLFEQLVDKKERQFAEESFFGYADKFANTSLETVMCKVGSHPHCIVHEGLFPQSKQVYVLVNDDDML